MTPYAVCDSGELQRRLHSGRGQRQRDQLPVPAFLQFFKLPPVTIPPFTTNLPMESVGCDETGTCAQ